MSSRPKPNVSKKWLKARYQYYNLTYFDGRLPDVVIEYVDGAPNTFHGETVIDTGLKPRIRLNRKLAWNADTTLITLLHEICHLATWEENETHGPEFYAERKRLLAAGVYDDLL